MARDMDDRHGGAALGTGSARALVKRGTARMRERWLGLGLPAKLLLLTAGFVMLAEILLFVPSVSAFRVSWLNDRLTAARLATLAASAVQGGVVPDALRADLLRTANVKTVAVRRDGRRRLILPPEDVLSVDAHFDLRSSPDQGVSANLKSWLSQVGDALAVYVSRDDRVIRVLGPNGPRPDDFIEIVMPEAPLRAAMRQHALNILGLSVIISLITAALVYLALSALLVRPMMRITRNMVHFGQSPEDKSRIIEPSGRRDEIGVAERELAGMQGQLSQLLIQKNRLAQLGLAVSKINHDLRNMLANAQLISDRLSESSDPVVQRFAPKLIASLDRAINFCNDSLKFGKAEEAAPRRDLMLLRPLVEEVGDGLGLPREGAIAWKVEIDEKLRIDADQEHLFRVLSNLTRNAVQALESEGEGKKGEIVVKAWREGRRAFIELADNGPGIPPKTRERLFQAFQASTRKGGSGLGLSIAAELVAAHGGTLQLLDIPRGAAFLIQIPDRSVK